MTSSGLEQKMSPCLVPTTSPLGQLEGGTNMIVIEGDQVGQIVLRGAGAGEGPTASAVISDVMDLARGISVATFGQPAKTLIKTSSSKSQTPAPYYLRMLLHDEPGALAKITKILSQFNVSIDRMRQYGHEDENAPVLIVTHEISHEDLMTAIKELPITLLLRPFNFETLTTHIYQYASDEMLEKAALPSLIIIIASLLPVLIIYKTFIKKSGATLVGELYPIDFIFIPILFIQYVSSQSKKRFPID